MVSIYILVISLLEYIGGLGLDIVVLYMQKAKLEILKILNQRGGIFMNIL